MATEPLRLPARECARCRIWTECGVCPICYDRLGPPPFAMAVLPEHLDIAKDVPLGEGPGTCSHCRLTAPFHRETCPEVGGGTAAQEDVQ